MNRARSAFVLIFSITAACLFAADRDIAVTYYQQAQKAFRTGDRDTAAKLLDLSLGFYPDLSEAAFLRGRMYLDDQKTTLSGISLLVHSLSRADWIDTNPERAVETLGLTYLRIGAYQKARSLLSAYATDVHNAELCSIWAETLVYTGKLDEAQTYLEDVLKKHPYSVGLYTVYAELLRGRGRRDAAIRILDRGLQTIGSPILLYMRAELTKNASDRRSFLDRYFQIGGSDPGAALLGMAVDSKDTEYVRLFWQLNGNRFVHYLEEVRVLHGETAEVSAYSGERVVDRNRDGYYEEHYRYIEGQLVHWIWDRNQDGRSEAEIEFEKGVPTRLILPYLESQMIVRYSSYPFVQTVQILQTPENNRIYQILPYQYALPALTEDSFELSVPFVKKGDWPTERDILVRSYERLDYIGPTLVRFTVYKDGQITRVEQDPDEKGQYRYILYYSGGVPSRGNRDLDGDGRYEIGETYSSGKLIEMIWDQNGDGRPEYAQTFEGKPSKLWDYNGDGLYDSREYVDDNGQTIRQFSSALNGVYDLTAVVGVEKGDEE